MVVLEDFVQNVVQTEQHLVVHMGKMRVIQIVQNLDILDTKNHVISVEIEIAI